MPSTWEEVPARAAPAWDRRLRQTNASFHQYPYWTEAQTSWRLRATYLVGSLDGEPVAFLSVLRYGFFRLRIGLVREGPAWLRPLDSAAIGELLDSLADDLRRRGFVAVAFTHEDGDFLEHLAARAPSNRDPLFSFAIDERESLCVALLESDEATAASFAPVARRDIRHAVELGFAIERPPLPQALDRAWPIWQRAHHQALLYGRSRRNYAGLLRRGQEFDALRLYLATLDGVAIQAILVALAGERATYLIGGLDRAALGDRPSPSCLLHFRALRECHAAGCTEYDFGSRSGPVHRFKRKFRPRERQRGLPVNWVLDPSTYDLAAKALSRLG